jgi:hypothetical protein
MYEVHQFYGSWNILHQINNNLNKINMSLIRSNFVV